MKERVPYKMTILLSERHHKILTEIARMQGKSQTDVFRGFLDAYAEAYANEFEKLKAIETKSKDRTWVNRVKK